MRVLSATGNCILHTSRDSDLLRSTKIYEVHLWTRHSGAYYTMSPDASKSITSKKSVYWPTSKPLQSLEWLFKLPFPLWTHFFTEGAQFMWKSKLFFQLRYSLFGVQLKECFQSDCHKNTAMTTFLHNDLPFSHQAHTFQWVSECS